MFSAAPSLKLADRILTTELPALVMAIVNCTPDSFWEKSRFSSTRSPQNDGVYNVAEMTERVLAHFSAGADIVDIGGESTRPGSEYVSAEEEMERIIPLIQSVRKHSSGAISVDTRKACVIKETVKVGADILNDVSALEDDKTIAQWASQQKIPVILMHKRGIPLIMQQNTVYTNVVDDIAEYLAGRVAYAVSQGIEPHKIILDAGIGFGKNVESNIVLIQSSNAIQNKVQSRTMYDVYGMLIGLSRKGCIGTITGKTVENRLSGTLSANMLAVQCGAKILRVHDTAETVDMLKILQMIG